MTIASLLVRFSILFFTIGISSAQAAPPLAPCPAVDCINLPSDSGALNVKDFGAVGDGVTDDTAAINAALAASDLPAASGEGRFFRSRIVYLPIGTYLVSGPIVKRLANGGLGNGMMLLGQSRQATIIKLKDRTASYSNAQTPRAVVMTSSDADQSGAPTANGSGLSAYANFIENMTIDAGLGNPGAIGVDYIANLHGAIRSVTIRAGLDSGTVGLSMQRNWNGPAMVHDLTVQGYNTGIAVQNAEFGATFNRITLNNQRTVGLFNNRSTVAISTLWTNEVPTPVMNNDPNGLITLVNAAIVSNTSRIGEAIVNKGRMNIRNLGMRGYSNLMGTAAGSLPSVLVNGTFTLDGAFMGNSRAAASFQAWSSQAVAPPAPPNTPVSTWVNIANYGARPNSNISANSAISAAFATGADTIYFPTGTYLVDGNIPIPPTVRRIVGMGTTLKAHPTRSAGFNRNQGMLRALNDTYPLIIQDLALDGGSTGEQVLFEAAGKQPLVLFDTVGQGSSTSILRTALAGQLFVENFSGVSMRIEGPAGAWMRQANLEGDGVCISNNGAPLWVSGISAREGCTVVSNSNNGRVEIFGGVFTQYAAGFDPTVPLFRNTDGRMLISYVETGFGENSPYVTHLRNTISGVTQNVMATTLPLRDDGRIVVQLNSTALPSAVPPPPPSVVWLPTGPVFGDSFGVNIKTERITTAELDKIASVGIKRVRIAIPWYAIEFLKGVYSWDYTIYRSSVADDYATRKTYTFHNMVADIRARKLHVDVTLHESNGAYVGNPIEVSPGAFTLPAPRTAAAIAGFANFAAATVRYYEGIYGKDAFTWHIWNEPDTNGSFAPTADAAVFGDLMSQSCEAIRRAVPSARVMGAALSARGDGDIPFYFITGMFARANPLNCINGLTVHPYRSYVPETAVGDFAKVAQTLAPWQPVGKPPVQVATDEWGYSMNKQYTVPYYQRWRNFSGEEQAALVLRSYLTSLIANLPLMTWYDWRNRATDPYEWEDNFGLIDFYGNEKPAFRMMRAVWPTLSGRRMATVKAPTACSGTEYALQFGGRANDALGWTVVWTSNTVAKNIIVSGAIQQVTTIFGTAVTPTATTGGQRLTITGSPLLIRHGSTTAPPTVTCG